MIKNGLIIIPTHVSERIDKDLDKLRDGLPEEHRSIFEKEREHHRQEIINHIGEHGTYPTIGGIEEVKEDA